MRTLHALSAFLPRLAALVLGAAGLAATAGCGSGSANVAFTCGPEINGGTLLTVDVVRATESEVERIRALGEKWFYDPLRDSLRDRTRTATFSRDDARCDKTVTVEAGKGERFLVIVADYRFQSPDPGRYLAVLPVERWRGRTLRVQVRDREFSIDQP